MTEYAIITGWIRKEDAQAQVKALIAEGKYQKGQIKLSSYRWADLNDHSKGYLARIMVIKGICPELEIGEPGRKKKVTVEVNATTLATNSDTEAMTLNYGFEANTVSASTCA